MAEIITRRNFLRKAAAGAAGVATAVTVPPGCASRLEEIAESTVPKPAKIPQVTFHVVKTENPIYTNEVFDLVKQFYKEEVGVDINFRVCTEEDLPKEYDHRTNFVIREVGLDRFAEEIARVHNELVKVIVDPSMVRFFNFTKKDFLDNQEYGLADLRKSTIFLNRDRGEFAAYRNMIRFYEQQIAKLESRNAPQAMIDVYKKSIESDKKNIVKLCANDLAHEIAHLAGCQHSHKWINDGIEEFSQSDPNIPNVMSYELPGGGKYGFFMAESHKSQIRQYFLGGQPFKDLQRHNFHLHLYCKELAEKKGYIKDPTSIELLFYRLKIKR